MVSVQVIKKLGYQIRFNENPTFLTTPNVLSKDRKVDCQKVRNTVIAYASLGQDDPE